MRRRDPVSRLAIQCVRCCSSPERRVGREAALSHGASGLESVAGGGPTVALAVDIGGTFTDVVLSDGVGKLWRHKLSTTVGDEAAAVVAGALAVTGEAGVDPGSVSRRYQSAIPMGRYVTPEEIANTVLFLCSDLASNTTGGQFVVDGGRTATGGAVTNLMAR